MNVSYAIMAHPARRSYVDELLWALGDIPVAWSDPPDAKPGFREPIWRTCRAALRMHTDAPYHLVIQDDAIPCTDFLQKVQALPSDDRLYMLFYRHKGKGWQHIRRMASEGRDFVMRGKLLGPAVVYPTRFIEDMIAYCDPMDDSLGTDDRIKRWAVDREIDTYVPIPSLVDHRTGPSFVGHPDRRVAWRFAG